MKNIIQYNLDQLKHLESIILALDEETYAKPVPLLHDNSLGKHCRHMLEFYLCFFKGVKGGLVNYDKRERNLLLENSHTYALATLETIRRELHTHTHDGLLADELRVESSDVGNMSIVLLSTVAREMLYLADHTVHHLALVRLGFEALLPTQKLDSTLGIAPSTQKHQSHVHTNVSA